MGPTPPKPRFPRAPPESPHATPAARRCQAYSREQQEAPTQHLTKELRLASPDVCGAGSRTCAPPAARPLRWQSGGHTSWERRTEALLGLTRGLGRRCPRGPAGREPGAGPHSPRRSRLRLMPPPEPARRDSAQDAQWSRCVVRGEGGGEGAVRPARRRPLPESTPPRRKERTGTPTSDPPPFHPARGPRRAPQPSPGAPG